MGKRNPKTTKEGEIKDPQMVELGQIIGNYTHGSQDILEFVLGLLQQFNSRDFVLRLIDEFIQTFQNFEVIQQTLMRIKEYSRDNDLNKIKKFIEEIIEEFYKKVEKLFRKFEREIHPEIKILTISNSRTIFELLYRSRIKFFSPEVYVLESLPVGEGKILDNRLKAFGVNSTLIKDSEMKDYVKKVDIVLMGADRIVSGKYFMNKVGSKKLAQAANKFNKPVYVVAFKEKIIDSEPKRRTIKSVRDSVEKTILERVDINLVTKFLTA